MLQFSLIVCSRGRPLFLERMLLGVDLLRYPAFELIIISDPKDLETVECITRHAPVARIGYCNTANLAKARNIGLSMARGDIIAFLDDDAVPEPDWLDQLAGAYASSDITAAGGFIRAQNGLKFQSRVVLIDEFGTDHHRARVPGKLPTGWFLSLTGTNFSVRRAPALALGGFDETYSYFLEETDFLLRLQQKGGRVCIVDHAEVHHGYAASEVREKNGAPKSLRAIARSKAYFCYINRRPETPISAIVHTLEKFMDKKRRRIKAHLRAGRLSADNAVQLLAELKECIQEGETLAKKGRTMAEISAADAVQFEPYLSWHQKTVRQRLCVLINTTPQSCSQWPVIRESARSNYEVTVIYFCSGIRHRVFFSDGLWEHQLSIAWRLLAQISQYVVRTEIQRVSASRRFEKIYVASNDPALEKAAAASGLQRFTLPNDRNLSKL